MIFQWPLRHYVLAASLVGVVGSCTSIGLLMRAQYRVLDKPYCTQAVELLQQNETAMGLIGKPIRLKRPDITDKSRQRFEALLTDIHVPFDGKHKSGDLHIEADRVTPEHEWSVKRLEIQFNSMPEKLLIVYKRKNGPPSPPPQPDTTALTTNSSSNNEWL